MAQIVKIYFAFAVLAASFLSPVPAIGADEPRTIIGLYANPIGGNLRNSAMFGAAEMPLNHLGLVLEPYHIAEEIPRLEGRTDIRGILIWIEPDDIFRAQEITALVRAAVAENIPVAIFGDLPAATDNTPNGAALVSGNARALTLIGVQNRGGYQSQTFDTRIVAQDSALVGYERKFDGVLPPVGIYAPSGEAEAGLVLERSNGTRTTPIMITPKGAFVASGYAVWTWRDSAQSQWFINPFEFFSKVFNTDTLPKADPTTLSGRRIYYGHIDGDGWLNLARVQKYASTPTFSSEVILREAVIPYPDLPVTIAPIAAQLDPRFLGPNARNRSPANSFHCRRSKPAAIPIPIRFNGRIFRPAITAPPTSCNMSVTISNPFTRPDMTKKTRKRTLSSCCRATPHRAPLATFRLISTVRSKRRRTISPVLRPQTNPFA